MPPPPIPTSWSGLFPPPAPPGLCPTGEQGVFSLWWLYFLFFFRRFSFLLVCKRNKKNLWPVQVGFLHDNIDTNRIRVRPVASTFSTSPAASRVPGVQNPRGKPSEDREVRNTNPEFLERTAKLVRTAQTQRVFRSVILTLNTEDDSVHNCFLVIHPLSVRHSHLMAGLG